MVLYTLFLKANLSGVKSLKLKQGSDICLSVRNPVDHEQVRERIVVDSSALEAVDDNEHQSKHAHSKHHAKPSHFSMKWSGASSPCTIRVVSTSEMVDSETFVPVLTLDCNEVEPYEFHPLGNEFIVENDAGHVYDKVDLSTGDWNAFDMGEGTTSVLNLTAKFE